MCGDEAADEAIRILALDLDTLDAHKSKRDRADRRLLARDVHDRVALRAPESVDVVLDALDGEPIGAGAVSYCRDTERREGDRIS